MKAFRHICLIALMALVSLGYAQEPPAEPAPQPVAADAPADLEPGSVPWATDDDVAALRAEMAEFFAGAEVRTVGSPGNVLMEERLNALFAASGFRHGEIRFQTPAFRPGPASVSVPGVGDIDMLAMHPGLFRPGNFPTDQVGKRLIYVGNASVDDLARLRGVDLSGSVAVVEFDSGYDWLRLMRFGVEAFIFLAADSYDHMAAKQKVPTSEVAVPRYFVGDAESAKLREALKATPAGVDATIKAAAGTYESVWARNLWVFIPGSDTDTLARQVVTFVAPIDSNGVVPELGQSAGSGANLFMLTKMLEDFKENPPKTSVILAAVNGHTQGYVGERLLAFNLLEPSETVLKLRNAITQDIRKQELIYDNYLAIGLDAPEKSVAEKLVELAAAIGAVSGYEAVVEGDAVRVSVSVAQTDAGTDTAATTAPVATDEEVADRFEELLPRLQMKVGVSLDGSEFPVVRITKVKTPEEKLIDLRSLIDNSLEKKTKIKQALMERARAEVNSIKSDLVRVEKSDMTPEQKAAEREKLNATLDKRINVLTLFNKVGVKTVLSDLSEDERDILRGYVDGEVKAHGEWARLNREERDLISANRAIHEALEGRHVALIVQLAMDWNTGDLGFSSVRTKNRGYDNVELGKLLDTTADELSASSGGRKVLMNTMTKVGGTLQQHFFAESTGALVFYMGTGATPSMALRNTYSSPALAFSPADTFENLRYDRVAEQIRYLRAYMPRLLGKAELPAAAASKLPEVKSKVYYNIARAILPDQFTADGEIPLADTVLVYYNDGLPRTTLYPSIVEGDVVNAYMQITDSRAVRIFYQLDGSQMSAGYKFDADFRRISHMLDGGEIQSKMPSVIPDGVLQRKIPFFPCGPEFIISTRYDATRVNGGQIRMDDVQILDGAMNSAPRKVGLLGISSAVSSKQTIPVTIGPVAVVLEPGMRVKFLATGKRVVINPTEDEPEGYGYATNEELGDDYFAVAARDMTSLNNFRLNRMVGVTNELASELYARGAEAQEGVVAAKAENDHVAYLQNLYESLGAEVKAYLQISSMTEDMLKAIIFYMILLLPFCFFVQKLLFKFVRVEAQMATFGAIFVLIFAVFRFIHPAFRLARAPEAILIAFIMFSLGLFVIIILHARFEGEMKVIFQTFTGMEGGAEVGTGSVVQKAMLIGVNNMKRRRTRTALTTGTIILITFAMLAFSSVSKKMSPTYVPKSKSVSYTGVMFHQAGSGRLNDDTVRVFEELFASSAERIVIRAWDIPPKIDKDTYPYYVGIEGGAGIRLGGVLGLSDKEPGLLSPSGLPILKGGRYFSSDHADEALLPVSAASAMGLGVDDVGTAELNYRGRTLTLVGLLDDTRFSGMEDINGRPILPMQSLQATETSDDPADEGGDDAEGSIFFVETSQLLVLPLATSRSLGAEPYSISVSLKEGESAWKAIDMLLTITNAKFWVASMNEFKVGAEQKGTLGAGVYYVGSGYKTSIGGMAKLIVPILIAGTIILNTMLGAVYERKYEIAVYNAIGLNPTHIGLFFLAEAFVYAVIGSVGGYLIGQVLALAITHWNLIQGLNLNFSSLTVVYVIAFTVLVVVLSTLYPAVVATRAAVPSGKRTWSLPANDGNQMELLLPFIYQPNLVTGIVEYLDDYFQRFSEASTGEMIATRIVKRRVDQGEAPPNYDLDYNLALAPYDLGVTQRVSFHAHYNTDINSYQITMTVKRLSGQDANWVTTNRPFLEKLRKHMMHWRNMSRDNQKIYVTRANVELDGGSLPRVEPAPNPYSSDSVPVSDAKGEPPGEEPNLVDGGLALFDEGAGPEAKTILDEKKTPDDKTTNDSAESSDSSDDTRSS